MAIGVYSLLEATLLVINAIAILNEERFLVKCMLNFFFLKKKVFNVCFSFKPVSLDRNSLMSSASLNQANIPYGGGGFGGQQSATISPTTMSPKMQILNLLHSIRTVARLPLIAINIVVIIFKLLFG